MYCVRNVTSDLYWVGANDHRLALFENCFPIPRGVSYNAYCLLDEKTVLFDTVDWSACRQLLENLNHVLAGRELDYLLINHLEPDHAACIEEILLRHPKVKVISNEKDVNDRVAWKIKNQMGFVILNKTNCASFLTPDGSIVVVIVNDDAGCTFNFEGISGRDNLKIYTTNDQYDLKLTYDGEYKQEVEIPGLSITTLIFS